MYHLSQKKLRMEKNMAKSLTVLDPYSCFVKVWLL